MIAPATRTRRPAPRAGRNLPAAIGVGLLLAVVVLGSLLYVKEVFLAIIVIALGIGVWELRRAIATTGVEMPLIPTVVGGTTMLLSAYFRGAEAMAITLVLTVLAILIWRAADGTSGALGDVSAGTFAALYPCFLAGFAALLLAAPDGHLRVLFFILVTVVSDIGGYAVGVFLGRHPIAPSISPKKSWEGLAGSIVTSAAAGGTAMVHFFGEAGGQWWQGALIGVVAALAGTVGDFVESSIKRDLGIKDMGRILPGHGGLMDRLDSLVINAPLVWLALMWFLPID